jgi:hypothetical protein
VVARSRIRPPTYTSSSKPHKIAAAQFAVDREIEESKIAFSIGQLKHNNDTNAPDMLWLERSLLPIRWPLFQGARFSGEPISAADEISAASLAIGAEPETASS